jgi:DNA-binding transcriptional LysR family regulator
VSYHLNQIERSIGLQLVRRTTRRVEPTEVGLRLYQHGLNIRNELLAARESVTALGRSLQGRVRLSVPSGYGQMVVSHWLIDFKRLYPGIVLDVTFENRVEDLLREEIDIAIRVMSEPPQSLVARELGPVRYVAVPRAGSPKRTPWPRRSKSWPRRRSSRPTSRDANCAAAAYLDGQRHEVTLEPTVISENFLFLRQAVLAGLGVGIVPDYVMRDDLQRGEVMTTLDAWRLSIFGTHLYMLYMPNRHHTLAASTFIEFVLERTRA